MPTPVVTPRLKDINGDGSPVPRGPILPTVVKFLLTSLVTLQSLDTSPVIETHRSVVPDPRLFQSPGGPQGTRYETFGVVFSYWFPPDTSLLVDTPATQVPQDPY